MTARSSDDARPFREKAAFHEFHHAIGCHSYAKLSYDLDGSYQTFRTQYAIDSQSPLADVTVRILLDDKAAVEKKNVKSGPINLVISIPLSSAKKLSLEVDYGENYATEDRFIWLDPALVRSAFWGNFKCPPPGRPHILINQTSLFTSMVV